MGTAIFGGTFDPVHWGHLSIAQTALSQLNLDRVIWVPDCSPPHKSSVPRLDFEHRWEMVRLAICARPSFLLSPVKTPSTGYSYAIGTLIDLQALYPHTQWYWIIGQDAFQTLPKWHRRQELVPACVWLVAPRPDGSNTEFESICKHVVEQLSTQSIAIHWQVLQTPCIAISSSTIRQYCRQKRDIRYLVPELVRDYITTHNLYQGEAANSY